MTIDETANVVQQPVELSVSKLINLLESASCGFCSEQNPVDAEDIARQYQADSLKGGIPVVEEQVAPVMRRFDSGPPNQSAVSLLKPCPFCGNTVSLLEHAAPWNEGIEGYSVVCGNDCFHGSDNKDEAIRLWNSRVSER